MYVWLNNITYVNTTDSTKIDTKILKIIVRCHFQYVKLTHQIIRKTLVHNANSRQFSNKNKNCLTVLYKYSDVIIYQMQWRMTNACNQHNSILHRLYFIWFLSFSRCSFVHNHLVSFGPCRIDDIHVCEWRHRKKVFFFFILV